MQTIGVRLRKENAFHMFTVQAGSESRCEISFTGSLFFRATETATNFFLAALQSFTRPASQRQEIVFCSVFVFFSFPSYTRCGILF